MDAAEYWKEIFQNIEAIADNCLASEHVRANYRNPETIVTFRVDDINHQSNACVCRTAQNTYEIRVFAGLVRELKNYSERVIDSYPNLFQSLDRRDKKKTDIAHSYLFYLWLEFVIFHEWAHALCGHLDFKAEVHEWYEMENEKFSAKALDDQTCQSLEAEADSYAAKFALASFSTRWEGLAKEFYPNRDGRAVLRDYLAAVLLLFRFFEELRLKAEKPRNTHPIPFNRAFIFLAFCLGEYGKIPGLPALSSQEKEMLFGVTAVEFYVKYLGIESGAYLLMSLEAAQFSASVEATIQEIRISDFRITK